MEGIYNVIGVLIILIIVYFLIHLIINTYFKQKMNYADKLARKIKEMKNGKV